MINSSQIYKVKYWQIFANKLGDFSCCCRHIPVRYRRPHQSASSSEETEEEEVAEEEQQSPHDGGRGHMMAAGSV